LEFHKQDVKKDNTDKIYCSSPSIKFCYVT
jgi:hypothetical protein